MERNAGQSTLEFAILICAVAGALLGMQIYLKRGIAGGLRDSADQIGGQYAPTRTNSNITTVSTSNTTTSSNLIKDKDIGGGVRVDVIDTWTRIADPGEITSRTGNETVGDFGPDLWSD